MEVMGSYAYKLPSNILLQEIKDGANPQVANLDKKRFVLCQEPNGKRRICASTLKEITGDKKLNARKNYSNECGVVLLLTLILECNDVPPIDEVNDAIQRRIRTIPFVSKFVSKELYEQLEDKTNVYEGNPYYKSDEFQVNYRQALIQILLTYWEKFQNNKYQFISTPTLCKEKASDYLAVSDNIFEWFKEDFEKSVSTDYIYIGDIYDNFKSSNLWDNMSKNDRRQNSESKFLQKIESNLFLQPYFKDRMKYSLPDKKYNTKPLICGWKRIEKQKEEDKNPLDY